MAVARCLMQSEALGVCQLKCGGEKRHRLFAWGQPLPTLQTADGSAAEMGAFS
jgi:hypothetical protein